jgi:hypothetical protein
MKKLHKPSLFLALGVFACAMAFAWYTQHAWEDWYITFKASKNLATGQGLSFMPGERVHTFTSVAGTLIPALLSFVTFNVSDDLVLWLYRIVNAGLFAFSAVLLAKSAGKWFAWLPATVLLVGVFSLDTKTIDFSINGMETPYLLLALILVFYFITFHPMANLKIRLGVAWALLEYARPDGFLYALLLIAGMLLFLPGRKETLKTVVASGVIALLIFSPWLLFTLWYYGTPIPHSIVAKGALESFGLEALIAKTGLYLQTALFFQPSVLDAVFTPPYAHWFNIPVMLTISRGLASIAALLWIVPRIKPLGKIASLALFGFLLYLSIFPQAIYPWYLPGTTLLALIALAFGFEALLERMRLLKWTGGARVLGWSLSSALIAYMLAMTLISAHQFQLMERIIERGGREQIGKWLKEKAASPHETVFLECVGYIGFYSGLKMYDWPGMTSPEMVAARKAVGADDWMQLIRRLEPDWLVLRTHELQNLWMQDSLYIQGHYKLERIFDANPTIDMIDFKPYEAYFRFDARFYIARKNKPATLPAPSAP